MPTAPPAVLLKNVKRPADVEAIEVRMGAEGFSFEYLNGQPDFLALLV